nr:immunoglobulin heavy chain junction region [Homo sapiens]
NEQSESRGHGRVL